MAGNGIEEEKKTEVVPAAPGSLESPEVVETGSYSFTAPSGERIRTTYVADKNGFRPEGAHLPTPPPVPESLINAYMMMAALGD